MWDDTKFIYVITCLANGKRYVGRTRLPDDRKQAHFCSLRSGKHSNNRLQADFNEFGEEAFDFEVIGEDTRENGRSDEFKWMEHFKTYDSLYGYNDKDPAMNPARKENGLSYRTQPQTRAEVMHKRSKLEMIDIDLLKNERHIRICKLYNEGFTVRSIAEKEKCSFQVVDQIIHKGKAKTNEHERYRLSWEYEQLERKMKRIIQFVSEHLGEEFIPDLLEER